MSRIRLNQEYRNKVANRMRVHIEQEDTQEKEKSGECCQLDEQDDAEQATYEYTVKLNKEKHE